MTTFRNFDGIDDWIRLNPGGVDATGAWTFLALIRPEVITGDERGIFYVSSELNQANPNYFLFLSNTGLVAYHFNTDFYSTSAVTINKWWLVAASRPAGAAQTIRFHLKNLTDNAAWLHENSGTANNQSSMAAGDLQIGAYINLFDFFDGDISMVAAYELNLSDANLESIVSNATALSLSPAGMWVLDQANVATDVDDETGGGATEKAISGTTVNSGTIPNWLESQAVFPSDTPFPPLGRGATW